MITALYIFASIWLYFISFSMRKNLIAQPTVSCSTKKTCCHVHVWQAPWFVSFFSAPNIFAANKIQLEMRYQPTCNPAYSNCSSSHVSGRKMKKKLSSYLQCFFLSFFFSFFFFFFSSAVPAGWYTLIPDISFLLNRWKGLAGRTPTIMLRADAFLQVVGLHSLNPS